MFTLIAATDSASTGEEISPILAPYPGLMFWTIVAFFLSMWVLKKFAFGPIQNILDKRREAVNSALENAERVKAESEAMLAKYEKKLSEARAESDQIIDRARKTGDEITTRMKEESEAHRKEQIEQTQRQIAAEIDKAKQDIRSAIADMTISVSEKVLNESIDDDKHRRLVENAVETLDLDELQKVGAGS